MAHPYSAWQILIDKPIYYMYIEAAYREAMVWVQQSAILFPSHKHITAIPRAFPQGKGRAIGAILALWKFPLRPSEADMQVLQCLTLDQGCMRCESASDWLASMDL